MLSKPLIYNFLGISLALLGLLVSSGKCEERVTNRLIHESSPYLLKHATNPVDWYPWSEDAFSLAKEKNKPILLSIGYLTCHWCNVMEEESFSDPQVAALINDVFVPIKVDREERPDIDQIYMKACHILSPSCGWPLTVFLTPAGKPFYAGTYIPKENRFGKIGLLELVPRVKRLWTEEHDSVLKSADSINAAIISSTIQLPGGEMETPQLEAAFKAFSKDFDWEHGGFGRSTKFPKPLNLIYLLRYWHRTGNSDALAMVEKTLSAMRRGGIYDHLGYGFHRYATDPAWRIPHFEKMLYDQALLVLAYIEAYQATAKKEYANTAREILNYVLQYLTAANGAFFSAESADSEGEEGKFYLWSLGEIKNTLNQEETSAAIDFFHIKEDGNFIDPFSGRKTGQNILYLDKNISPQDTFEKIRIKLLLEREKRPRPEHDDKVLTDWNGLMIGVLAKAGALLGEPGYVKAAQKAALFIVNKMTDSDGRLFHRYRQGEAGLKGHLDDYAFFVFALIELYQATFDAAYLKQALVLNEAMIAHFWDTENGAFYLTADDAEKLLVRSKEFYDGAIPSGNSIAAYNLLRLARLTGRDDLEEKASTIARAFGEDAATRPDGFTMFLSALDFAMGPSVEVVISGEKDGADTKRMLAALKKAYVPNMVVIRRSDDSLATLKEVAPFVGDQPMLKGKATAYVCVNHSCSFPTTSVEEMLKLIAERTSPDSNS